MNRKNMLAACKTLAKSGVWCIPEATMSAALGYPDHASLRVAMSRHVKAGVIEKIAPKLYLNSFCEPPAFAAHRLANFLRPDEDFYLSLEAVLSEASLISQIPNGPTFVTTGASYSFDTHFGMIHFVHTEEAPEAWKGHLTYVPERQVWQASEEKALADLRRYGRNLRMVNELDEREKRNLDMTSINSDQPLHLTPSEQESLRREMRDAAQKMDEVFMSRSPARA